MNWTRKNETHSWQQRLCLMLVRRSKCGRYHIAKLPDGTYKFAESHARRQGFPVLSISFSRLASAKREAEKQEAHRLTVWHYFVERAERNKAAADAWIENPVPVAGICEQGYREDYLKDVDYITDDLYAYAKYRAHLRSDTGWSSVIDPSGWRDWQAMLKGTYLQYWLRRAS